MRQAGQARDFTTLQKSQALMAMALKDKNIEISLIK